MYLHFELYLLTVVNIEVNLFNKYDMKSLLKILLLSFAGLAAATFVVSCSDDDNETIIDQTQLPANAKTFIDLYFAGDKVAKVEQEHNPTSYDVYFVSGAEVEFDAAGEWTDVKAAFGSSVPTGIVPDFILSYLETNLPDAQITEISKTISGGYEVDLNNDTDLVFDSMGNLVEVD